MYEAATPWTIVGPDGTTVEFNDGASGLLLEEVSGWDSASVRTNVEDLPEDDGAIADDAWLGQRPWTLRGRIESGSAALRNQGVANLQRALRALRGDLLAKSSPSGLPAMQATARFADLKLGGGYVKTFQISLISADPRAYSQAEHNASEQGAPAPAGAEFDWAFDVDWGGGTGATLVASVANDGNIDTPPKLKVWGPAIDPRIALVGGGSLYLDGLALVVGEWVELDVAATTALKQDGVSVYDRVRFPGSEWWKLPPGSSTVELWCTGGTGLTELEVTWRDAWA